MGAKNVWWALAAVVTLAGLDLLGAYLAKEFSVRPRWIIMIGGLVSFGMLFFVYVKSLSLTDLWVVTFGWVVLLEIGVLLLDRFRFGTHIPTHKMVLAGMIVMLQVALMLPSPAAAASAADLTNKPSNSRAAARMRAEVPRAEPSPQFASTCAAGSGRPAMPFR